MKTADPAIMAFLAGEDVELDKELLLFRHTGQRRARIKGLQQIDILSPDEATAELLDGLQADCERYPGWHQGTG